MKAALIGTGRWGNILKKYIPEYFNLKYVADSKFNKDAKHPSDRTTSSLYIKTSENDFFNNPKFQDLATLFFFPFILKDFITIPLLYAHSFSILLLTFSEKFDPSSELHINNISPI